MGPKKKGSKPAAKRGAKAKAGKPVVVDAEAEARKEAAALAAEEKKKAQRNALGQLTNATFTLIICFVLFFVF